MIILPLIESVRFDVFLHRSLLHDELHLLVEGGCGRWGLALEGKNKVDFKTHDKKTIGHHVK